MLTRLVGLVGRWNQKHQHFDRHLPLEDHLLQDIGMTRMDVEFDS